MRYSAFGAVAALVLSATATAAAPASISTSDAAAAAQIISAYRQAYGLPPVKVDQRLSSAAAYHAQAIAGSYSLSHGDFAGRMAQFGIGGGAAENLAAGTATVSDTLNLWKGSAGHNSNLLLAHARRVGLARVDAGSGHGRYWVLVLAR